MYWACADMQLACADVRCNWRVDVRMANADVQLHALKSERDCRVGLRDLIHDLVLKSFKIRNCKMIV